jgi:hypothetical protein
MGLPDDSLEIRFYMDPARERAWLEFTVHERQFKQPIECTKTPCNYGGERVWFVCPSCRRRVGKLYLLNMLHSCYWSCRHCQGLTYVQRRERRKAWTYQARAQRIADRWLQFKPKDPKIYKTKWMRWSTYQKRAKQYNELQYQAARGWTGHVGAKFKRLITSQAKA